MKKHSLQVSLKTFSQSGQPWRNPGLLVRSLLKPEFGIPACPGNVVHQKGYPEHDQSAQSRGYQGVEISQGVDLRAADHGDEGRRHMSTLPASSTTGTLLMPFRESKTATSTMGVSGRTGTAGVLMISLALCFFMGRATQGLERKHRSFYGRLFFKACYTSVADNSSTYVNFFQPWMDRFPGEPP